MNSKTRPVVGSLLVFIGAVHTALGVVVWLTGDQDGELMFWFTAFGVVAVALGVAVIELERARGAVPVSMLACLAVITVGGLIFQPVSGFWTLLAPLAVGVIGTRRQQRAAAWAS